MLAKLDDLKRRLDQADSSVHDTLLSDLLAGVGALFDRACDRVIEYAAADAVETLDGGETEIRVRRWPITSITSIKEASDYDFAAATALTANEDYRLLARRGRLLRLPAGSRWVDYPDAVQVVYRGGYLDPVAAPVAGVDYVPEHFQEACLLQAAYLYRRRDQLGSASLNTGGGVTFFMTPYNLLPAVERLLSGERRWS